MATNNILLSDRLLAEIQVAAQVEKRSVEEVLQDAVKKYLDDRSWTNWLDRNQSHAKSLGINESDVDRLIAESRAENRLR